MLPSSIDNIFYNHIEQVFLVSYKLFSRRNGNPYFTLFLNKYKTLFTRQWILGCVSLYNLNYNMNILVKHSKCASNPF